MATVGTTVLASSLRDEAGDFVSRGRGALVATRRPAVGFFLSLAIFFFEVTRKSGAREPGKWRA